MAEMKMTFDLDEETKDLLRQAIAALTRGVPPTVDLEAEAARAKALAKEGEASFEAERRAEEEAAEAEAKKAAEAEAKKAAAKKAEDAKKADAAKKAAELAAQKQAEIDAAVEGEGEVDPLADEPADEPTYTLEQVVAALREYREIEGTQAVTDLVASYGVNHVKLIGKEHYADIMRKISK